MTHAALNFSQLASLDGIDPQLEAMPVEIWIDAIAAFEHHDYRRCIIFAAIAAEAGASARIEQGFEEAKSQRPGDLRLINLPLPGGRTQQLDPVFDALRRKSNGNYLRGAVHEAMLYVYGKSLLADDEKLFRRLTKLSATRNQLVHFGKSNNMDDRLNVDADGAREAIASSGQLLSWLDYQLPEISPREAIEFDTIAG